MRFFSFQIFSQKIAFGVFCAASSCSSAIHAPHAEPPRYISVHRGDTSKAPGNSITAIRSAIAFKVDFIEIDLRLSKDGSLFLFHDKHFSESNISGPDEYFGRSVEDLTNREVLQIRQLGTNEKLARYEQALKFVRGTPVRLQLDPKGDALQVVKEAVKCAVRENVLNQIVVTAYGIPSLEIFRQMYPQVSVLARLAQASEIETALEFHPKIIQLDGEQVTPKVAEQIHTAGVLLLVKTVDSKLENSQSWCELYNEGVDVLLTDKAERLIDTRRNGCALDPQLGA